MVILIIGNSNSTCSSTYTAKNCVSIPKRQRQFSAITFPMFLLLMKYYYRAVSTGKSSSANDYRPF